jgi:hypothetical protein
MSKRIIFKVELYHRGKRKIPSVGVTYASRNYEGVPDSIDTTSFHEAARDLCKQLVDAGELD